MVQRIYVINRGGGGLKVLCRHIPCTLPKCCHQTPGDCAFGAALGHVQCVHGMHRGGEGITRVMDERSQKVTNGSRGPCSVALNAYLGIMNLSYSHTEHTDRASHVTCQLWATRRSFIHLCQGGLVEYRGLECGHGDTPQVGLFAGPGFTKRVTQPIALGSARKGGGHRVSWVTSISCWHQRRVGLGMLRAPCMTRPTLGDRGWGRSFPNLGLTLVVGCACLHARVLVPVCLCGRMLTHVCACTKQISYNSSSVQLTTQFVHPAAHTRVCHGISSDLRCDKFKGTRGTWSWVDSWVLGFSSNTKAGIGVDNYPKPATASRLVMTSARQSLVSKSKYKSKSLS